MLNQLGFPLPHRGAEVNILVAIAPGMATAFAPPAGVVDGRIGDIVSIRLPLDQAASLGDNPDIIGISLAKSYRPTLDKSIPDTGGDLLRSRFSNGEFAGLTGKGSIVAIIDSGIDWQHPDFRKPDGSTRIKYLWDPADPTYILSNGFAGSPPPSGGQGTVYTEAQINAALQGIDTVYSKDECGHGTHVAGIAAGNGAASGDGIAAGTFVGMAPEADIVVVRVFGDDCAYLGQQINLIQAGAFVDQMAQALGRPYVINLSLGTQIGGHDGYDLEEIAIDSLVGPGKPGKAVVVSAGNDSGRGAHSGGQFGSEGTTNQTIRIEVTQKGPNQAIYDLWFHRGDNFSIFLEGGGKPEEDITDWVGYAPLLRAKRLLFITERSPSFTIKIVGQKVLNGRFDGWVEGNGAFRSFVENSRLVSVPGTSRHALTVGAHTTKVSWVDQYGKQWSAIGASIGSSASFSSPGPTRDGRQKPELSAPGQVIASAMSRNLSTFFFPDYLVLADEQHVIAQGTSMSAPHASGAIALLFEKFPQIDSDLAQQILISSTRSDFYTEPSPNPVMGFGKLNAADALEPAYPRVMLSTNQTTFRLGETLKLSFVLQRGLQDTVIDGWVAVQTPSGEFAFLKEDGTSFDYLEAPYRSSMVVSDAYGLLYNLQIKMDLPVGEYKFYAVGVTPGTDPFNPSGWLTNLAGQTINIIP